MLLEQQTTTNKSDSWLWMAQISASYDTLFPHIGQNIHKKSKRFRFQSVTSLRAFFMGENT